MEEPSFSFGVETIISFSSPRVFKPISPPRLNFPSNSRVSNCHKFKAFIKSSDIWAVWGTKRKRLSMYKSPVNDRPGFNVLVYRIYYRII